MKKTCVILLSAIALVSAFFVWNSQRSSVIRSKMKSMVDAHLLTFGPSTWMIEAGKENMTLGQQDFCQERKETLLRSARAWCPDSDIGVAIKEWLPRWGWGIEWFAEANHQQVQVLIVIGGEELVTFVPRASAVLKSNPYFFCNEEKNGRAVFIKALKMPDQIYAGFVLHEIGHAEQYWHRKRQAGPLQEVEMHILTGDVFDAYSHGSYKKAVTEIAKRSRSKDFRKVYRTLRSSDLEHLDHIVGSSNAGREVESNVVVQHLLSIGFASVDQSGGDSAKKVEVYEWVSSMNPKRSWEK